LIHRKTFPLRSRQAQRDDAFKPTVCLRLIVAAEQVWFVVLDGDADDRNAVGNRRRDLAQARATRKVANRRKST
jgi:hypothetical protein